jgi:hypothetical protein
MVLHSPGDAVAFIDKSLKICGGAARSLGADFLVAPRGFEPAISAMRPPRALDGVPLPTAMAFFAQLRQYWSRHYRPNALRYVAKTSSSRI